jgi:hypothetical protein
MNSCNGTTTKARGYAPVNGLKMCCLKMCTKLRELAIRWFASLLPSDTLA